MFFEFLVLAIALVISVITAAAWVTLIFCWKRKVLRYVLLLIGALGTWFCITFWTFDADESPGAKAWQGRYTIDSCHSVRPLEVDGKGLQLIVEQDHVCRIEDPSGDQATLAGEWHYVTSDDRPYLELKFHGHAPVKVFGKPEDVRTIGSFPIKGCL